MWCHLGPFWPTMCSKYGDEWHCSIQSRQKEHYHNLHHNHCFHSTTFIIRTSSGIVEEDMSWGGGMNGNNGGFDEPSRNCTGPHPPCYWRKLCLGSNKRCFLGWVVIGTDWSRGMKNDNQKLIDNHCSLYIPYSIIYSKHQLPIQKSIAYVFPGHDFHQSYGGMGVRASSAMGPQINPQYFCNFRDGTTINPA